MSELRKILHAEDDPDIREIAKISLEMIGEFELLQCNDGFEAIKKAEFFAPDMLLMDVMMPGLDGPDAVEKLRRNTAFEKTPVVFVTAKATKDEVGLLEERFSAKVITKPFDPVSLPEQLRDLWMEFNNFC